MRRRSFIASLALLPLAPANPYAQNARTKGGVNPLVGWLGVPDRQSGAPFLAAFTGAMAKALFVEGRDYRLAARWADSKNEALAPLMAELMSLKPAVLIVEGTRGAELSAQSGAVPTVAVSMAEGTALKVAGSNFAHPSGNVTGVLTSPQYVTSKLFELAKQTFPTVKLAGVIIDSIVYDLQMGKAATAAAALGIEMRVEAVSIPSEIAPAVARLAASGVDLIIAPSSAMFRAQRKTIVEVIEASRTPAIYDNPILVEEGGLMSYGVDTKASFARSADLVLRLVRGISVADVPIEQPTPVLTLNIATARRQGLVIPPAILALANQVFE
jgi:putative ABC transport system substrate-binding protein